MSESQEFGGGIMVVLVTGQAETLGALLGVAGASLVGGSATQDDDGAWRVSAYVTDEALRTLQDSGYDVTVLSDASTVRARWDTVLGQVG